MISNNRLEKAPLSNKLTYKLGNVKRKKTEYELREVQLLDDDGSALVTSEGEELWGVVKVVKQKK